MNEHSAKFSLQEALRLMNTPAGQQLLTLLQNSKDEGLRIAMEHAAKGDMESAKESLRQIAGSKQVRELLSKMEER